MLPLVLLWLLFALVYMLVPNTKVNFGAALFGGIVGGSLWHVNNLFGFLYASRVVSYSVIYGSLGLVPVFHGGAVFFLGDFALRRAGFLRVSKPPGLFAGKARRKREPARTRIRRAAADDMHRPALSIRPAAGHDPENFHRTRRPVAAGTTGVADAVRRAAGRGNRRTRTRLRARTPARNHHRASHPPRLRAGGGQELPMRDGPVRAEVWGNSPASKKPNAQRPSVSPCSRSSIARRPNWNCQHRKTGLILPLQRGHGAPDERANYRHRQHPRHEHLRIGRKKCR